MTYLSEVLADNPKSYYRMNDLSGGTCVATVGTNGSYNNSPTLGVVGPVTGDTAVRFASASSQDMSVASPNQAVLADVFTLESWFKRTTLNAAFNGIQYAGKNAAQIYLTSADKIEIAKAHVAALGTTTVTVTDTTFFHYLVWTKNGATNHIYLDAVDVTPTITNQTFTTSGSLADNICSLEGSLYGNLTIGEAAYYDTELSAARVAAHFAAAQTQFLQFQQDPRSLGRAFA